MFPPLVTVPFGLASFFTTYLALQALAGGGPVRLGTRAWAGAASFVLFMLLFRVYDELKDLEHDRRLAAAGDPRYRDRPLVTGRLLASDLVVLRWTVTAALLAVNLPLGAPLPLVGFAVAFVLIWLSFHWYFSPAISRNLLLAFATHNPLNLMLHGYAACVFAADFGARTLPRGAAPLLTGMWLLVATWELSRKIRLPEQETEYQTYSSMLGWKTAALLPAITGGISAALLAGVGRAAGLGWVALAPLIAAALALAARGALLRLAPTPARARLQPWAELYAGVATINLVIALALKR
jgi:4-hydroxybenzoate polyprenyltransferase